MSSSTIRMTLLATAACLLAACGGGGGGSGVASTPTPSSPPPPKFPLIFPGVTQTTDFAVMGYENPDFYASAPTLISDGFAVRYDAAQHAYILDVPSAPAGAFQSTAEDADSWRGLIAGTNVNIDVAKPTASNRDPDFEYTSLAAYYQYDFNIPGFDGAMAFGTATPSAGIPTTGSAVLDAIVAGYTLDPDSFPVGGSATLQFDFGAGTLAGHLDPTINAGAGPTSLGTYTFVNTVFGVGSTSFSGGLQHPSFATLGSFNGIFTGPAAQELMARWSAPYTNPNSHTESKLFGVWIGRKQ